MINLTIVLTEGKFLKNQFSIRYFRRDQVVGLYNHPLSPSSDVTDEVDDETNDVQSTENDEDGNDTTDDSSQEENDEEEHDISTFHTKPLN